MRRFYVFILLFSLPFLVFIFWVFTIDLPRKYAYLYTRNEGCNIEWIYRRIYENDRPIDVAFLGTSHTGCGVKDYLIDSLKPGNHAVNLAYCQGGRSIQFTVLKDLLTRHHPKKVILEVRMDEDPTSHRDFGMVGRIEDVVHAPFIVNLRYTKDLFKAFQVRYMFFQDRLLEMLPEGSFHGKIPSYSFQDIFKVESDKHILEEHAGRELRKLENPAPDFIRNFHMKYPVTYIQKIKDLASTHDCELIFLYLPSYGMVADEPVMTKFYRQNGTLLIPPADIFRNPDFWFDTEHLNSNGADLLTRWIASQL